MFIPGIIIVVLTLLLVLDKLKAMVDSVAKADAQPFKAQMKGLKEQHGPRRRRRPRKKPPPRPKGLKKWKKIGKEALEYASQTLSDFGPYISAKALGWKEHFKDIAEETVLEMIDEIEDQRELDDIPQGRPRGRLAL